MNTTVVHHSADYDGIFCREIARKFLPDAELIGWDFSDPPLGAVRLTTGDPVYVLDLPIDKVFAITPTLELCKNVIWIDHHKSAIESHPKEIPSYLIDGVAACRLAWQFFSKNPPNFAARGVQESLPSKQDFIDRKVPEPLAVRLAGEYDIWDKRDERADILQFGLRSRELTDFDWSQLLSWPPQRPSFEELEGLIAVGHQNMLEPDGTFVGAVLIGLLESGKLLRTYQQRNDAGMMHRSFILEWEGLKFLALTTARCNSLTFASKDVFTTGHDALMGFYFNGKTWTVSLYHAAHRKDIDLSKIAVKHGGGGHAGACGFVTNALPFLRPTALDEAKP